MEQILEEKTKRHAEQGEDQPFYFGKGVYVPIGQYLLLKNDKKDGKIQLYELGENPEIVGEQLSQSLVMLSKLGFTNAFSISSKVIGDHTIGGGKDCKSKIVYKGTLKGQNLFLKCCQPPQFLTLIERGLRSFHVII